MRRLGLLFMALVMALPVLAWGPGVAPTSADTGGQWTGEYFTNPYLGGTPTFVRLDSAITFDWGAGSPAPGIIPTDNFSVRWSAPQTFNAGVYTFTARSDDGVRVYVDDALVIDGWVDQEATTYTGQITMTAGQHWVRVEYYERTDQASISVSWLAGSAQTAPGGWAAEYYNNTSLAAPQAGGRLEKSIDYNWGTGSPLAGINADNFSVRWWGFPNLEGGTYTFVAGADDGIRVFVDNIKVVDAWQGGSYRETRGTVELDPGVHTIRVEYFEMTDTARVLLYWTRDGDLSSGAPSVPTSVTASINTGALNVRSGPGVNYAIVGRVYQGGTYSVTARSTDNTWLKISGSGVEGWVNNLYVNVTGDLNSLPVGSGVATETLQVVSNASLRIRRGPSTNQARIAALTRGETATVVGRTADSTWLEIRTSNGTQGWVSASFVTFQGSKPLDSIPVTG